MYDFISEAKVVGVADIGDEIVDVWITDSLFKNIKQLYSDHIINRYLLDDNIDINIYDYIYDNDIKIDDLAVADLENLYSVREQHRYKLICGMIIAFIFVVLLCINFISYSIIDSRWKIGVLKALGMRIKDVLKIFTLEMAVIVTMLVRNHDIVLKK